MIKGASLVVSIHNNHHLFGSKHRPYSNGERRLGHFINIIVEKP